MCVYQYDFNVQKIYIFYSLVLVFWQPMQTLVWYGTGTRSWYHVIHPVLYLGASYNCRKNDLLVFSHLVQAFGTVIRSTFRLSCVVGSFSKAN